MFNRPVNGFVNICAIYFCLYDVLSSPVGEEYVHSSQSGRYFIAKLTLVTLHKLVQPGSQQKLACFLITLLVRIKGVYAYLDNIFLKSEIMADMSKKPSAV